MTQEVKEEVEKFLRSGERDRGLKYLQDTFNITPQDAALLVETLENEMGIIQPGASPHPGSTMTPDGELSTAVLQMLEASRKSGAATGCLQTVAKGLGVFLMIISIMFIVGAGIIYFIQSQSINNSDRVAGVVREMKLNESGGSAPVIEFEWRGRKHSHESTFYSSPPEYYVGDEVFLFVNRDDPEDITIDTFFDRWALIVGLSVPGTVVLLISFVFLYFGKRKF